jgi:hypothetical protein
MKVAQNGNLSLLFLNFTGGILKKHSKLREGYGENKERQKFTLDRPE